MRGSRRPRSAANYRRRGPTREPYDLVLIVCEGEKTEPNYLQQLRATYKLSSVNIKIVSPPATDPFSIVDFAIQELRQDSDYDRAFCVFDRDEHTTFASALAAVKASDFGRSNRLVPIISTPCFELWLLLHYRYSNAPYARAGTRSACDMVVQELQTHFPGYNKGKKAVFAELASRMDLAIANAKRLEQDNISSKSENPATRVHHLVEYLIGLKHP
jgi:hypothetical protein